MTPLRSGDAASAAARHRSARGAQAENALKTAVSQLNATLESTTDGLLVVASDNRITLFNQRFVEMWGIPAEILDARDDQKAMAFVLAQLSDPAAFVAKVEELKVQALAESVDVLHFTDGRIYERFSRPQMDGGIAIGRVWSFRDITARICTERMQAALHHISEAAHLAPDLPGLFQRIHGIIGELLPAKNCYFALHDEHSDLVTFPYWMDETDPVQPQPNLLREGRGLTDLVLRNGEPLLLSPDAMSNLTTHSDLQVIGTIGLDWLGVPLKTDRRTIGVLAVQTYFGSVGYTVQDLELLQFVSIQVAAAVERRQTQQAMLESELRFRSVFDQSPILMCLLSFPAGEFQEMNAAGIAAFGYSREELLGRTWHEFNAWVDESDQKRFLEQMFSQGYVRELEARMRRRNGEIFTALVSGSVVTLGGRSYCVNSMLDINERKRSEAALQESEENFRNAFEHSMTGMALVGLEGNFLQVNASLCAIVGYTEDELLTRAFRDITHPDDLAASVSLEQSLLTGETHSRKVEKRYLHRDGSIVLVYLAISLVRDNAGRPKQFIAQLEDITQQKLQAARIEQLAFYDSLTGLPNRALFLDRLEQILAASSRHGSHGAILFLDLDRFKEINDSQGHAVGDLALVEVARRFQAASRGEETLARLGGDEFVLIAEGADHQAAVLIATRLQRALVQPLDLMGHAYSVGASIGIALYPADGQTCEDLIKHTDIAMYSAKAGGGGYRLYQAEMGADLEKKLTIAMRLGHALEAGELQLYYQPQIDLGSGYVIGAEALLRWQDPLLGWVSPAEFIPIAEERGMMGPLGDWVLREACRQVNAWSASGLRLEGSLAINVSALQLDDPNIVGRLLEIVEDARLSPQQFELELTESSMLVDPERAVHVLESLSAAGFGLSIDDFGTGHSSLAYLKRFAADKIKIDISFVRNMLTDADDLTIVTTIIAMARSLGLKTTAEGVEEAGQATALRSLGCDFVQGYHFGRPVPAETFMAQWLQPAVMA